MQFDVCTDQTSRLAYSKEFCTMLPHRTADAAAIAAAKCQTRSAGFTLLAWSVLVRCFKGRAEDTV